MPKLKLFLVLIIIFLAGCNMNNEVDSTSTPVKEPTLAESTVQNSKFISGQQQDTVVSACVHPAGWTAYQLQINENLFTLGARYGISVEELMAGNCLVDVTQAATGSVVYVPLVPLVAAPQTILPLGISIFIVDPTVAPAGSTVTLVWQGQGAIMNVRVGWLYNGQFIEEASHLPAAGSIQLPVFNDGRDSMTFMVRVSDGVQEAAAQSVVKVQCSEGWFFAPEPMECPTAPLVTSFREQRFERGTIVYIPVLGTAYVMISGMEALRLPDEYIPGMPLFDGLYRAPEGFQQSNGPIYYLWRKDGIREALGYAIDREIEYTGMLQRTVTASGENLYFSASNGHVYQVSQDTAWGVVIPR
ncbi:MAG: hypothetical protein K8I82_00300 [Anaerolineae bacterium]|nr:hypothetical protein [Anaerolineae bacterium]